MSKKQKDLEKNTTSTPDIGQNENVLTKEQLEEEKRKFNKYEFDNDFYIFSKEAFFGLIFSRITKVVDWDCPTAYIGPVIDNNGQPQIVMGYNPLFFRSIKDGAKRRGVFKHELYHMILKHIFERAQGDIKFAPLWNVATDLAINSLIGLNDLPDKCLFPGKQLLDNDKNPIKNPYADFIASAPGNQSSDWYMKKLKEIAQDNQDDSLEKMKEFNVVYGIDSLDEHDKWGGVDPELAEELQSKVIDIVGEAALEAEKTNNWGNIPAHMQGLIRKMLSKEINWKSIVKNFIGRVRTTDRTSTIKRINKKMPYIHPGVKRKNIASFAVFIDQSGSMSDKDIAMLFSELEGLAKETQLDVFFFDTEIDFDSHVVWKRGKKFPVLKRTRCGGTDFNCIAKFCNSVGQSYKFKDKHINKNGWSGIVILTDGYAPKMQVVRNTKVLWVITKDGSKEAVRPGDLVCKMGADDGQFATK